MESADIDLENMSAPASAGDPWVPQIYRVGRLWRELPDTVTMEIAPVASRTGTEPVAAAGMFGDASTSRMFVEGFHVRARLAAPRIKIFGHFFSAASRFGNPNPHGDDARERFGHHIAHVAAAHSATTDLRDVDFFARRIGT